MRCGSCEKFTGLDTGEPEVNSFDWSVDEGELKVDSEVRLTRNCSECGDELKETTFSLEGTVTLPEGHQGDEHVIEVNEDEPETTERYEGKGRGMKSFYGVTQEFTVKCSCGVDLAVETPTLSDECAASAFEEI